MERTPGALFSTSEMVAGERFKYSPSVRRLMVCPGCGSVPGLARLGIHNCCNILRALCTVISIALTVRRRDGPVPRPFRLRLQLGCHGTSPLDFCFRFR